MSAAGNIPQKYVYEFAGNPTNVSTSILNPPKGALVINNTNGDWYRKTTGYGDNSGYSLSGSGSPQLPAWTFMAGTASPTATHFQANAAIPADSIQFWFSDTAENGSADFGVMWSNIAIGSLLILTNSGGKSNVYAVDTITDNGSNVLLAVSSIAIDATAWSGDYVISFALAQSAIMGVDSGWTAPESSGSKTQIANYAAPSFTGGDTVDISALSALGDKVQILNAWAQALETALASNLRPNA